MKLFTVYLSIFAALNMGLAPAYAQNNPEKIIQKESFFKIPAKLDFLKFFKSLDAQAQDDTDFSDEQAKGEEEALNKLEEEGINVTEYTDDDASIALTAVLMLVVGFFAPAFAISCPKSPDVWINLVAGLMMVVTEAVFWGLYEKGSTQDLVIYEEKKSNYSAQLDAFSTAMQITKKAETWMNAKYGIQIAVAVIFGIASAVVLAMSIAVSVATLGIKAATAQACPLAQATVHTPLNKFDPAEIYIEARKNFNFPLPIDEIIKRMSKAKNIGELAFIDEEVKKWNLGEVKSQDFNVYRVMTEDKEMNAIIEDSSKLTMDFTAFANILIASANATETDSETPKPKGDTSDTEKELAAKLSALGIGAVGGIVAGAVVAAKGLYKVSAINGWIRSSVYLTEVTFTSAIAALSKKSADQLGERAEAYKKLYEQIAAIMANAAAKGGEPYIPVPATQIMNSASSAAVQELDGNCFTDDGKEGASADPSCGCKAQNSCKTTKMPPLEFPNLKTPTTMSSSARLTEQMSNQVYSGDMSGASLSAQSLAKNAVAVQKMNDSLISLGNKKLVEQGNAPVDFKKMQDDNKKQAMSTMQNSFNSLSAADQNAFMKGAIAGGDKKGEKGEGDVVASGGPAGKPGAGAAGKKGPKKSIFQFLGAGKDSKAAADGSSKAEGEMKKLDEYEDSTDQISSNSAKNIFKIIEIRYMKSAYPVFFKEKE